MSGVVIVAGDGADGIAAAIRREHAAASAAAGAAVAHALEAGRLLAEARQGIPHGGWESFVRDRCGIAPRTARLYLQLDANRERIANRQRDAGLTVRSAARLVAEPRVKAEAVAEVRADEATGDELRLAVPEWYRPGVQNNGYHRETQWFFQVWPHPQGEPWVHLIVWCPDNLGSWSHGEGPKRGIRCDALGLFLNNQTLFGIPPFDDAGWDYWHEPAPEAASEKTYNTYLFHSDEHYRVAGLGLRRSRKRRRKAEVPA